VPFYPRDVVSAVYATATWLAGWLAGCVYVRHTPVLYQNGKPMLKLSRPPGSPINLASYDLCADTQFQAEPFQRGGVEYSGVGKNCDFRRKSPFISETVRDSFTMERWVPD